MRGIQANRAMVMLAASLCGGFLSAKEYIQEPVKGEVHASTVLPLRDGGYVAAWFGGTKEAHPDVAIWGARRIGGVWENPRVLAKVNPESPHFNPVLRRADDGRISLYFKVGRNCSDWRTYLVESRDEGRTWSEPCELVAGDVWGGRGPVRNKCIRLKSGRWLAPASREFDPKSRSLKMLWRAFVDRSDDDGRTWTASPVFEMPDQKAGVIQPTLWVAPDGRVRAYLRSTTGHVWETESADDGVTWAPARETKLPNNNSGIDAVTLRDGRHLLIGNLHGNDARRSPITIAISNDGDSWTNLIDLEEDDGMEYSYPCIIETSDGRIVVLYTWHRKKIAYAILKI